MKLSNPISDLQNPPFCPVSPQLAFMKCVRYCICRPAFSDTKSKSQSPNKSGQPCLKTLPTPFSQVTSQEPKQTPASNTSITSQASEVLQSITSSIKDITSGSWFIHKTAKIRNALKVTLGSHPGKLVLWRCRSGTHRKCCHGACVNTRGH